MGEPKVGDKIAIINLIDGVWEITTKEFVEDLDNTKHWVRILTYKYVGITLNANE